MKRHPIRTGEAVAAVALAVVILVGCQEATPVAGPPGPAGPRGPAGEFEAVVRVFTMRSGDFSVSGEIATVLWPMPELTDEVFREGVVVAHWRFRASSSGWRSLPEVFQWDDLVIATTELVYSPGFVGLQISSPSAIGTSAVAANMEGGAQLRVAVVR